MRKKKKYEEVQGGSKGEASEQDKNKASDDETPDQTPKERKAESEEEITPEDGQRMRMLFFAGICAALIIAIAVLMNAAGKTQEVVRKPADSPIARTDDSPEAGDFELIGDREEEGSAGDRDTNPISTDAAEKSADKDQKAKADENAENEKDESVVEKKDQEGIQEEKTYPVKETKQETNVPNASITSDKPQQNAAPEPVISEEPSVPVPADLSTPPTESVSVPASPAASAGNNEAPKVIAVEEPAVHTHTWVEKTRTIHHDAVTEQIKVIDQEAYVEPIYETVPVYKQIPKYICNVCGEEFAYSGDHSKTHIDWETLTNPFSYHVEFVQGEQIGTEVVQIGSRTYPEKSHMETVVLQEAYDEVLSEGYVCSGCGAIKQ